LKENATKPKLKVNRTPKPKQTRVTDLEANVKTFIIADQLQRLVIKPNAQPINVGAKFDHGKNRLDLITPEFEWEMGNVLTHGAELYGENSWQGVPDAVRRYTAALKRHTNRMTRGEIIDPSTGLYHAAQIAVNAMFLQYFQAFRESW
jgi:hypothetical protein